MTISIRARSVANDLERFAADVSGDVPYIPADALPLMRGAAALIRDLAANQLPDFDSIQPATPEPRAAEVVEAWSQRISAQYTGVTAAARLSIAAAWIKARDQEIGNLRAARAREIPPPQALPYGFSAWRKLGEYLDARDLPKPGDSDPLPPPASDLQSQLAPLFALFRQQSQAQAEHWRALEFQTRRIADANALRALSVADKLETVEGDALLMRVRADALK